MRHRREHVRLDPLPVEQHALLVAARTEGARLARVREQVVVAAGVAVKVGNSRLERRIQQIEKLDASDKRQVLQLIDAFIERGQLKRNARSKQHA